MNKHTPGPWFFDTHLHIHGQGTPVPCDGGTRTDLPHVATANRFADAALIVAAPDLLAALDKLCGYIERDMEHNAPNWAPLDIPEYARACDALAKAKGEI